MAEPRYSDERQQFLQRLARGKCHAVMRQAEDSARPHWRPCVADEVVGAERFATKPEAVAAAKDFREKCRQQLAETNGSM